MEEEKRTHPQGHHVPFSILVISGCVKELVYLSGSNDLFSVKLDTGVITTVEIATNLNDFRDRLQEAANFGHAVKYFFDGAAAKISRLSIFPCLCTCEKRSGGTTERVRPADSLTA